MPETPQLGVPEFRPVTTAMLTSLVKHSFSASLVSKSSKTSTSNDVEKDPFLTRTRWMP